MKIQNIEQLKESIGYYEKDEPTVFAIVEYVESLLQVIDENTKTICQPDYRKELDEMQYKTCEQIKEIQAKLDSSQAEINLWKEKWKVVEMFLQR